MFHDLKGKTGKWSHEFAVCIVGSGPAGITLFLELIKNNIDACLVEAGDFKNNGIAAEMKEGNTNSGLWYNVEGSRLLKLGGTSGHWAGYCAPLDSEDYTGNEILDTKWPIGSEVLIKYNKQTNEILELGEEEMMEAANPGKLDFGNTMEEKTWRFSTPVRFADKYAKSLENVKAPVFLNAVAKEVHFPNTSSNAIEKISFVTSQQTQYDIQAQQFVFCMGGIETARFLLGNENQLQTRMDKSFGNVGRYFADHFHLLDVGSVLLFGNNADSDRYRNTKIDENGFASFLQIEKQIRQNLKLNNLVFRLEWDVELDNYAKGLTAFLNQHKSISGKTRMASVSVMGEQKPNFESAVNLLPTKNALGINHFNLNWQCAESDLKAYRTSIELLGRKLGEFGIGRLFLNEKYHQERLTKQLYGGNHHLGTTRMSTKKEEGVTDKDAKIWGLNNGFVCSSSLFPTYGSANPTYNIVRFALRLAEHLQKVN